MIKDDCVLPTQHDYVNVWDNLSTIDGFVIDNMQSDRILKYANLVLYFQEGAGKHSGIQYGAPRFDEIKQFFKEGSKILFLGCGNGEEVKQAIDLGYDAFGVTLNIDNIDYAKMAFDIELIRADMHSTPFETGMFDGVIAFETFEHSYSPLFFLFECNRLLKEGGRVFTQSPTIDSGTLYTSNVHHIICCNSNQLKSLLLQANFDNVQVGNLVTDMNIIDDNDTCSVCGTGVKKKINDSEKCLRSLLYTEE